MTKTEALDRIAKVLSRVSGAKRADVKPGDKLKDYVPVPGAMGFALEIDKEFPILDLTDLTNSLYDPIAKVRDLVEYVVDAYEEV